MRPPARPGKWARLQQERSVTGSALPTASANACTSFAMNAMTRCQGTPDGACAGESVDDRGFGLRAEAPVALSAG